MKGRLPLLGSLFREVPFMMGMELVGAVLEYAEIGTLQAFDHKYDKAMMLALRNMVRLRVNYSALWHCSCFLISCPSAMHWLRLAPKWNICILVSPKQDWTIDEAMIADRSVLAF